MLQSHETHTRAQYAGHETFPLRHGWLKKTYDAVQAFGPEPAAKLFRSSEAMAHFGVGKNMLGAMRHWALATGVISDGDKGLEPTAFGRSLFGDRGSDPYLEAADNLWWLHWSLVGRGHCTAETIRAAVWFAAFNFVDVDPFTATDLLRAVDRAVEVLRWENRPLESTLKRDVECLLRSYVAHERSEDALSSPFVELRLIAASEVRGSYHFNRGLKGSLPLAQLWRMVEDYWDYYPSRESILLDDLICGIGSPGRVLKLNREAMHALIPKVEALSDGHVSVADLGGRAQLVRAQDRTERSTRRPRRK